MTFKEVRLSWEDSQKHYLAISEIEEKAWLGLDPAGKIANTRRKKIEAKIHNETNDYLRKEELLYKMGGFYKTVMTSED